MIVVDGSHGEGGGSILRLSLALSIYTKTPFKIINIRKYREKYKKSSGLNKQNLTSVMLAQKICNAKVVGARFGSSELEFYPGEIVSKNINLDIGSAGCIFLALQSVLLPCVFSGKQFSFTIKGGTDVAWSPGFDYFNEVFLPFLEDFANIECNLLKRGYYPKGNGKVYLKINSFKNLMLKPIILEQIGELINIKGASSASKDLESIGFADEEADKVMALLTDFKVPISITRNYSETDSTGSSLLVYGLFNKNNKVFRSGIYRVSPRLRSSISEEVSYEFKKLINENVVVDEFLADQILPFVSITTGVFKTVPLKNHLSQHLESNIYVAEIFLNKKIFVDDGLIKIE